MVKQVKKSVSLKLTGELKKRIEKKARLENRSRNGMIEYMIKFYLEVTKK
jgi:hypothetical protein